MNQYRKLIVTLVGLVLLFLNRKYGVDLLGMEDGIADLIISGGTAFFVWLVPNAQVEQPKCQCSDS